MNNMETISDRYSRILESINNVCMKTGRNPEHIKLVVVTKKQSTEKILQVIQAGASILGENYPEEGYTKFKAIPENYSVQWHMIGHIQSRKLKFVAGFCSYVHTIDRLEIASGLDKEIKKAEKTIPALLEVNLSGEENKFGFSAAHPEGRNQLFHDVEKMLQYDAIELLGLMTMPPFTKNAEDSREIFRQCRLLQEEISRIFSLPSFIQLSMGTSQDYEVAIQEGATFLRIGEAIMGERSHL